MMLCCADRPSPAKHEFCKRHRAAQRLNYLPWNIDPRQGTPMTVLALPPRHSIRGTRFAAASLPAGPMDHCRVTKSFWMGQGKQRSASLAPVQGNNPWSESEVVVLSHAVLLRLMSLMASASCASCFQAVAPTGGLNRLLNFPYHLEVSDALSFPDPRKRKVFACRRISLPGSRWRDNPVFKHR